MVAQDIGGAIRGPVRADIFFGFGPEAERRAGAMKGTGALYVLLPNALAAKIGKTHDYPS
jgi:membrane-bound lytic murein transglycosylase A